MPSWLVTAEERHWVFQIVTAPSEEAAEQRAEELSHKWVESDSCHIIHEIAYGETTEVTT